MFLLQNLKPWFDNGCAILRIICTLDSKPTSLSESSIATLSEYLPGYLIDIVKVRALRFLINPFLGLTHLFYAVYTRR